MGSGDRSAWRSSDTLRCMHSVKIVLEPAYASILPSIAWPALRASTRHTQHDRV